MLPSILAAWRAHEAVNRLLLDGIPDAGLAAIPLLKTGKPGSGRDIARSFAHMVDVRVSHLRVAEQAAFKALPALAKGQSPTREWIVDALAASSAGVEQLFARVVAEGTLIRQRDPLVFLAYLIGHESHHRGQFMLALKQNGISLPDSVKWGVWELWFKA